MVNLENRHGEYGRRKDSGRSRDGQEIRDKCKTVTMKADTSSDRHDRAGEDKRRKKKTTNRRKNSTRGRKNQAEKTSSSGSSVIHSAASIAEKKRSRLKAGPEVG